MVLVALAVLLDLGPFADEDLSEAEFLARGDELCAQAHSGFEESQDSPPRTASEARELTSELLAIAREERHAIADLDAPTSLDAAVERYLNVRERGIGRLEAGVEAAEGGDAVAYEKAQAGLASGQLKRRRLARRIGFEECSRVLFGREQLERDAREPAGADPSAPPTVSSPPTGTQ